MQSNYIYSYYCYSQFIIFTKLVDICCGIDVFIENSGLVLDVLLM